VRPDTGPFLGFFPFRTPLALPVQDSDGEPHVSIDIPCTWLPYVRGALLTLTMQYAWPQDDPVAVLLAQNRAMSLIAKFVECDDAIPPIACGYDFALSDAGWNPISPYTSAQYSPGDGWGSQFLADESRAWAYLSHSLSGVNTITHIEFTYAASVDGSGPNDFSGIYIYTSAGLVHLESDTVREGTHIVSWTGSISDVTEIRINVNSGESDDTIIITEARYDGIGTEGCG
jgi:hypothetical protein